MKVVIVDIEGGHAVAMTQKGDFIKIRENKGFEVGYEVDVPAAVGFSYMTLVKVASMAAVFLLFIGIGYGAYCYNTPYSYIDIDINPSIEVTTNTFGRIIDAKALNPDGEKVLASGRYKNRKLSQGIRAILKSAVDGGYLKRKGAAIPSPGPSQDSSTLQNAIMFTVAAKDETKADEITGDLESIAEDELEIEHVDTELVIEKVSLEKHDEAKKIGVSPGKVILVEKLRQTRPDAKIEDYKNAPVRDIMKLVKEDRKNTAKAKVEEAVKKGQGQDNVKAINENKKVNDIISNGGAKDKAENSKKIKKTKTSGADKNKSNAGVKATAKSSETKGRGSAWKSTKSSGKSKKSEVSYKGGNDADEDTEYYVEEVFQRIQYTGKDERKGKHKQENNNKKNGKYKR